MQTQSTQEETLLRTDTNAAVWFEIPVSDLERAKVFYEHVLGVQLQSQRMDEYDLEMFPGKMELGGAAGCLSKGPAAKPSSKGTMIYFSVTDIDAVLNRVRRNDGKIIREKLSIGEHGFIGVFEDTEGNTLGLHSMK